MTCKSQRIHVDGTVQGVGFRPFVWSLAKELQLSGWVRNSSSGVDIQVEGTPIDLEHFVRALHTGGPPLAQIESVSVSAAATNGHGGFAILESRVAPGEFLPVTADVGTCSDCLREMRDPTDRRYRYPFLNCTQCGPRFTIVRDLPYDRSRTTMSLFRMCRACAAEYADPTDRRFHAQPVACPRCGPQLWLEQWNTAKPLAQADQALRQACECLLNGGILAVKGLGGFHLACDATNPRAVARLRQRKHRDARPFALMVADVAAIEPHAEVSEAARHLLESTERPVLLLPRRTPRAPASRIVDAVAPGRPHLGFMLPYTPLHHLLLQDVSRLERQVPLVMTSANLSGEPIIYDNDDARSRLGHIADLLLLHDRTIHIRADDSVAAEFRGRPYFYRRARGYAPRPIALPFAPRRSLLAVGAELKNTFCLTRDKRAFVSHHMGDLEHFEAVQAFEHGISHYERLFRIAPQGLVHDLHPDFQSTRYALRRARADGVPAIGVQHHHAHIAACMADNGLARHERVLGVAFDGSGFGTDAAIWGGEFLVAGYADFERATHLRYWQLPGGDAAVRKPYRTALSLLRQAAVDWDACLPPVAAATAQELAVLETQLQADLNAPHTSSMGRLFDAVASLLGVRQKAPDEAQAACELEAAARLATDSGNSAYGFDICEDDIDATAIIRAITNDLAAGVPVPQMARQFHQAVARMVLAVCEQLRSANGLSRVALSGGVWQNQLLLRMAVPLLEAQGFEVLLHRNVPANDGGLSLGQALVGACRLDAET